jgi:basic amino acid/polyamine antiporter, APA family
MPVSPTLPRTLGLVSTTAMVVGIIIGASIFVQPSEITRQLPSTGGILLAWLAAGVLTLTGALVCAELAAAFPQSGGVYVFLSTLYSPALGFLWGWAMFWSMHSGIIAAIAIVFARYASLFVPLGETGQHVLAAAAIGVLTLVNYAGVRYGASVQTIVTAAKVAAIVAIIGAGLILGHVAPATSLDISAGPMSMSAVALAIAAGLFAFGGWHMVTYAAGETVDAGRTIPRALWIGITIVTICYAGLNFVYLRVLSLEAVRASSHVASDAAEALFGAGAGRLIALVVIVSTFGALNGIILAGPRVYFAMAADGLIFRGLGAVHPRFHTPSRAILLQGLWSAVLAFATSYRTLFMSVVNTEWIFFGLVAVGLLRLRRRVDYQPPYRMPGVPFVPLLFAVASWGIVIAQTMASPRSSAIGLGLVAAGLPVYLLWHAGARRS